VVFTARGDARAACTVYHCALSGALAALVDRGIAVIYNRDIRDRLSLTTPSMPRTMATDIEVDQARWRELPAVARLQQRAFRRRLAYRIPTLILLRALPRGRFLVARHDGEIVGCAIGDRHERQIRVVNLAVDPPMRRRGIATTLLRALEAALPNGNLVLMVEAENTAAQALYRREGYVAVGTTNDYYGRGHAGIWMQKKRPATTTR